MDTKSQIFPRYAQAMSTVVAPPMAWRHGPPQPPAISSLSEPLQYLGAEASRRLAIFGLTEFAKDLRTYRRSDTPLERQLKGLGAKYLDALSQQLKDGLKQMPVPVIPGAM
jgi:hypothetical protein